MQTPRYVHGDNAGNAAAEGLTVITNEQSPKPDRRMMQPTAQFLDSRTLNRALLSTLLSNKIMVVCPAD